MSRLYSLTLNQDGSYHFISEDGNTYLVYFSEYTLNDVDQNMHVVNTFGFVRDGAHHNKPFTYKYDERIRDTIIAIINSFFDKADHKALLYFCFGDDGFARHRHITFKKWCAFLNVSLEGFSKITTYNNDKIYGSIIVSKDNPLKRLIVDAFETDMYDAATYQ